ncbi:MAG: hypothetical protein J6D34_01220 [Atopobiaceae bacterium]|nr:hypothetical protein [Atopobiaceae bacterium]
MSSDSLRLCGMDAKMVFGETMARIASHDPSLTVVVSDYGRRLNLDEMRRRLPEAFVQCGIAEQSQVEVASALANEGFHVVAPSYATFITARVLDQVRVLLGMMRSPVVLVGLSAGCEAGTLGASHMALEDIGCMRMIPGLTVVCPADNIELAAVLEELLRAPRPAYVRISQYSSSVCVHAMGARTRIGQAEVLREAAGAGVSLLATGPLTGECLKAAELLSSRGIEARVVEFATVKPVDTAKLDSLSGTSLVVTVEDHGACGGFGSAVAEYLSGVVEAPRVLRLGMPDEYMAADRPLRLLERAGLTAEGIAASVQASL